MKVFLLTLSLLLNTLLVEGQESKFKALFIYKFIDYIEWPSGSSEVVIGVVGSTDVLDELKNFTASKSGITVKEVKSGGDLGSAKVLYIPNLSGSSAREIVSIVGEKPILIITDQRETVGNTSDIGFFLSDGKLRFVISKSKIEKKNMLPSSKLLSLGETI